MISNYIFRYLFIDDFNNTENSEPNYSTLIDFSNNEAVNWFTERLANLKIDTGSGTSEFEASDGIAAPMVMS